MLPAKFFNPSCFATDITARAGNTTAVSNIPTIAGIVLLPAFKHPEAAEISYCLNKHGKQRKSDYTSISHRQTFHKSLLHSFKLLFVINSRMPRHSSSALTILYNLPVHHHRSHQNCPYTTDQQFLFPDDP